MIFVSTRAGGLGAGDFYVSSRRNKGDDFAWETPQNITAINSTSNEFGPWAFEDEETGALILYFNSNRPGGPGGDDIYTSTIKPDGTFSPPTLVPELSSSASDTYANARPDGLELFLTSNRTGTLGGNDLWVATRASTSAAWSPPVNLGPVINSTANEQRAAISSKGTSIIFFSNRPGGFGNSDLYETHRARLDQACALSFALSAIPSTVGRGERVTVIWTAPGGRPFSDWVGLYAVGAPDSDFLAYEYTRGLPSGSFQFTAPSQAGQYEFRYFVEDSFVRVARSNPVTVR